MSYLIFARKYRPQTFEEMIGQKSVVQTLQNAIRTNRVTQAYLFSGMRGTGKTTAARVLAKALNCAQGPTPTPCNKCDFCVSINEDRAIDVLEIDGASSGGIEQIRALRDSLKYKPIYCRNKIIIIDEVHQVTGPAFNALLKTLEEPPANTVFIFATTEFHKVPATILSRCQHFEFKKISNKEIINHLMDIAKKENITISPSGLSLIADASEGSLRDAQSLLDQALAFSGEVISDEDLKEILGAINRDLIFEGSSAIIEEKADAAFALVAKLVEGGQDLRSFYKELIEHFRNLLLASSVDKPEDLLFMNAEELERLKREARKADSEDFLRYLTALQQAEPGLKFSSHPRIFLEALLVKLSRYRKLVPLTDLLKELESVRGETGRPAPSGTVPSSGRPGGAPSGTPGGQGPVRRPTIAAPGPVPKPQGPGPVSAPEGSQPGPAAGRTDSNKAVFETILEGLRKEKAALAAIVEQVSSFKIKEDALELFFTPDKNFYMGTIRTDARLIERICAEVTGRKLSLRLLEQDADAPRPAESKDRETETALKDPTVRYFMDTFKAQVLSVDPVKKAPERE
jgi:DNA polymerase III subunit gamma/tau